MTKFARRLTGLLVIAILLGACTLLIGARWSANQETVEAVEAETAPYSVMTLAPAMVEDEFYSESAPAATPVATTAPVSETAAEQFPISVVNGNSNWGPYWVLPTKETLSVEPATVAHIESLAEYADEGWFTAPYHTVDAIDESQLSLVSIYGATLPNVGDANLRSEDHGKEGVELARALYSYILRVDGRAYTLKAEPYDREIHILVGFLKVGEADKEYWSIWENHTAGYYTLCYVQAGKKPVVEQPTWTAPSEQTQEDPTPTPSDDDDKDPAPVWEDPTITPDQPVVIEEPWDSDFNFGDDDQQDPAPVWEDPSEPSNPVVEPWDSNFNWDDTPSQVDPAPVWEDVSEPSTPAEQTWDSGFNFETTVVTGNVDPAPVWETVSEAPAVIVESTTSSWDSSFNFSGNVDVSTSYEAPAAAPVVEAAPVFEAPSVSYDPAPVFESSNVGSSDSSASADDGWDAGFNF